MNFTYSHLFGPHLVSEIESSRMKWERMVSQLKMAPKPFPNREIAQLRKRRQEQKRSPNVEYNESTLLPSLKRDLLLCGVFRFTIRNNEKVRIIRYPLQIHW